MPTSVQTLPEPSRLPWTAWVELFRVRHLQWSPYTLAVPGLPPALHGLRVLHLTDVHITPVWMPAWDTLLARVAADPPDLICLTGDFVEHKHDPVPALPNVRRFVNGLRSRLGVYATLGNHDGDVLATYAGDWPVRLLCNETVRLTGDDASLELFGAHGVERHDPSPRVLAGLGPKPPGTLRIGLAHYPDQVEPLAGAGADVVLAGHTHGGQVCLPGGWPLMTHDSLPRRLSRGVHRVDGRTWLAVGRGLGFSSYPVRAFCPAEAVELTLVAAPGRGLT